MLTSHPLVSTKTSHLRHLLIMAIGQEEIGRRIAQARDAADLTQQELAERIGIETAQTISRYERGETEVKIKRLRRIAEATGKPLSFFIQVPDEPVTTPGQVSLENLLGRVIELLEAVLARPSVLTPPGEASGRRE